MLSVCIRILLPLFTRFSSFLKRHTVTSKSQYIVMRTHFLLTRCDNDKILQNRKEQTPSTVCSVPWLVSRFLHAKVSHCYTTEFLFSRTLSLKLPSFELKSGFELMISSFEIKSSSFEFRDKIF